MLKSKVRLWGAVAGALVGIVLCLISYCLIECDECPLIENVRQIQTFLLSFPGYVAIKLQLPEIMISVTAILYWAFLGWLFCAVVTIESKFRNIILIILAVLLAVVHWRYYLLIDEIMEGVGKTWKAILLNMMGH